ncbi:MAG: hypothetical protein HC855_13435 [Rhizobiales bacterium]|nr:hypothetical protein [Hyphomicrobiales bacterium]
MKSLDGGKADPSGAAGRALERARSEMRRSEEALKGEDSRRRTTRWIVAHKA